MSLSDIILAVLCQSEGLAWPLVVLPLNAQVFGSSCISTKPAISGFIMKTNNLNDFKKQADGVSVWQLGQWLLKLKLKVELISDDFFAYICKNFSHFCLSFSRAPNSPINVKYKCNSASR